MPHFVSHGVVHVLFSSTELTQMDHWLHYMVGVLGHHVVTTLSTNHSAYLIANIIVGVLENSLLDPVTVNGNRIDKGRHEREAIMGRPAATDDVPTDHGVIQDSHSLASLLASFPGVSARVARGLAATGLSLAEIAALEEDALLKIDGIGATTAAHLRHLFHSLRGSTQPPVRAKRGAKRKQKT